MRLIYNLMRIEKYCVTQFIRPVLILHISFILAECRLHLINKWQKINILCIYRFRLLIR